MAALLDAEGSVRTSSPRPMAAPARFLRFAASHKSIVAGAVIVALIALVALLAPVLSPYSPTRIAPLDRLNCRLVVALAAVPTSPLRAERIDAVRRAVEEVPRWELADARRDPLFAWLWARLERESPELVAPMREVLHRDDRPPPA